MTIKKYFKGHILYYIFLHLFFVNIVNELEKHPIFRIISTVSEREGILCFVVGGFVRDLFLKRDNYDIDIVCLGSGIQLAKKIADAVNADNFTVYKNFGTAMFKHEGLQLEFVGARKESYNPSSRKPVVENGTFEDDQLRRDFTINTLAVGLNKGNFGEVINYLHGFEDLQSKLIRTPVDPNITFSDDPLRMMRAIRFASQLNFTICTDTFEAIKQQKERIKIISKERIRDELNKIILSPKPSIGFKLLSECGLLQIIFPELEKLKGQERINNFSHKDIFLHTLQVLDNISEKSEKISLRWAALLHDIEKPFTKRFNDKYGFSFHGHEEIGARWVEKIFSRLHLPKNNIKYIEKLIRLHLRPIIIAQDIVTDSAVRRLAFEAGEDFEDLMLLCRADITSHNPIKIEQYFNNFEKVEKKVAEIEVKDHIRNLQPVISGEMIMKELNLKSGPLIGELKSLMKEAILNGEVENKYEPLHEFILKSYQKIIEDKK